MIEMADEMVEDSRRRRQARLLPHLKTSQSMADNFRTLGLPCAATQEEVKSAYRKLALQNHPDKNQDVHPDKFLRIQEAYEAILKSMTS